MFSNLRTEGDGWNHYVLPESMQVFDMQDDLVTITETDDPILTEYVRRGDQMVWYGFVEHRRDRPGYSVELERDGQLLRLAPGERIDDPGTPPHVLAKFISFRPVSTTGACRH
jgi:hypothetical protein